MSYTQKDTAQGINFNIANNMHNIVKKDPLLEKDLVKFRHLKDKFSILDTRRRLNSSSRFLDNYYNPKMHKKPFIGGKSKEKMSYVYDYSGLAHNYENKEVPQKMNNEDKKKLITLEKHYEEFNELNKNDIIITIEHCSNCIEHSNHTNHENNIYLNYARCIQKCILLRYPFIRVLLKPIETDIIRDTCKFLLLYIS